MKLPFAKAPLQVRWAKKGNKRKKQPKRADRTEEQKARAEEFSNRDFDMIEKISEPMSKPCEGHLCEL